jgi:hypothetical protein
MSALDRGVDGSYRSSKAGALVMIGFKHPMFEDWLIGDIPTIHRFYCSLAIT